ncbi:MAG: hypothetical protein ACFFB3_15010 [Candidatus Hodarchaeota archaeon]
MKILSQGLIGLADRFIHQGYVSAAGGADEASEEALGYGLLTPEFFIAALFIFAIILILFGIARKYNRRL